MAFKVGKMLVHAVIIGLLLAILYLLVQGRGSSAFEGAPLVTMPGAAAKAGPKSIQDLQSSLECVAGPSEKAEWYSRGLNPGGVCGISEYVRDQERDYTIADGVGGSLLEK